VTGCSSQSKEAEPKTAPAYNAQKIEADPNISPAEKNRAAIMLRQGPGAPTTH